MKTKKLLATLLTLLIAISLLSGFELVSSAALNDPNNIKEIGLTLNPPKAGDAVDLANSSVTCAEGMDYKVVAVRWYMYGTDGSIYNALGTGGNDKYFRAGRAYTVKVSLQTKGDKEWNYEIVNDEYVYHIDATVNGQPATVEPHEVNPENSKLLCVSYTFVDGLPKSEIIPHVYISNPVAGKTKDEIPVLASNPHQMSLATWDENCNWFARVGGQWSPMDSDDKFVAGKDYRLVATFVPNDDFIFSSKGTHTVGENKYIYGYVNGRQMSMKLTKYGDTYLYDHGVSFTYDFVSCETQKIDNVSFSGISAPVAGQYPQYAVTIGDATYSLVTDEAITGGAQYGFVNGISWSDPLGHLSEDTVLVEGRYYHLTFFIKSDDIHSFADSVIGDANVGYVEVVPIFGDPTLAMVTVEFGPCGGGVMNNVSIGGFREPSHGASPDSILLCGQGYEKHGEISWIEVTENGDRIMAPADPFIYGNSYKMVAVLKSTGNFTFASRDNLAVTVNGKPADLLTGFESMPEGEYVTVVKYFDCTKTVIDSVGVEVADPVEDFTPPQGIALYGTSYSVVNFAITDSETGERLNPYDVYTASKYYSVRVVLAPKDGYFFDESTVASINGKSADIANLTDDRIAFSLPLMAEALPRYTITFVDESSSIAANNIVAKAGVIVLPDCELAPIPVGMKFVGWTADGGMTVLSGEYYVSGDIELVAVVIPENEHKHVYNNDYVDNGQGFHEKHCIDTENCTDPIGSIISEQHYYGNSTPCDVVCTICGYVRTGDVGFGYHNYATKCSEVCSSCGAERVTTHTPGPDATCTEPQICTVCEKILVDPLGHIPGDAANCGHAQKCTVCDIELSPIQGAHTPGSAATCTEAQKCTVCNTVLTPAKGHSVGAEWLQDENAHWHTCTACNVESDRAEHADENGDKICDVCERDISKGLTGGAIALIVVGSVLGVGAGGFAIFWFVIKKKSFADLIAVFKK